MNQRAGWPDDARPALKIPHETNRRLRLDRLQSAGATPTAAIGDDPLHLLEP